MKRTIVVAGKNDIAVNILKHIKKFYGNELTILVVCNRTETGRDDWQSSLRWAAKILGVSECRLEDTYNVENMVFLSLEFDQIVKPEKFITGELYNIHFSLLPKYRGMYTSAFPILNGEKYSGVTLHRIDRGIDTGDIIAQERILLEPDETAESLYEKYIAEGTALTIRYLDRLIFRPWEIHAISQQRTEATYYSKQTIDYRKLKIDLNQTAVSINRQIRAYSFRHYQMPEIYGRRVIASEITGNKSQCPLRKVQAESDIGFVISTLDYDLAVYYDRFDKLMDACQRGDAELVREICVVRQHVNQKNEKGETPYMIAKKNGHEEIARFLRCCGAVDDTGKTIAEPPRGGV